MTDLFWPGDHRAGAIFSDATLLATMVSVENAWLAGLVDAGIAPASALTGVTDTISDDDAEALAAAAESDGNPVTGLLRLLRARSGADAARWLHRGLTSQDVIDTALVLCLRDAIVRVRSEIDSQVSTLAGLAERHQRAPMVARTLTQPALPGTVGMRMANWLSGILDAADGLAALPALPVQA